MTVVTKDKTPQGYTIQIEDWSEDYPTVFKKNDVVAVYPISKANSEYRWILAGDIFRCMFHFRNGYEARTAYELLIKGMKKPEDFADYTDMRSRRYLLGKA